MKAQVAIVGAGHNGLVCATYLARAGFSVCVLEARSELGGGACTETFFPGFRVSSCSHLLSMLDALVTDELSLQANGLRFVNSHVPTVALSAQGDHVVMAGSRIEGKLTNRDIQHYGRYLEKMRRFAGVLGDWYRRAPPRLAGGLQPLRSWLRMAARMRQLDRAEQRDFLRLLPGNIHDVLQSSFESEALKGALAFDALKGASLGPRSNNTVLTALHGMTGEADGVMGTHGLPAGGMGAIGLALAAAARQAGVTVRTDSQVSRIVAEHGRVTGVELASGETISATLVVSNADPKSTLLQLVGPQHLDVEFAHRIRNIRMQGVTAKLHIALDGLPPFANLAESQMSGRLLIAPDLRYLERAFNRSKYGQYSESPALEVLVPSLSDPSMAPAGKHVMSVLAQYAPYHLAGGWDAGRDGFEKAILQVLEEYAPGLSGQILSTELLTPVDLEQRFGMTGGHWHHGEIALDQFSSLRPVAMASQYEMPLSGLYLCGAGTHPGGGIMGTAGRNAAHAILGRRG